MIEFNKAFINSLFEKAVVNPRLRESFDLRTSPDDNSQRILNVLMPGTQVPIHKHPHSAESIVILCGKLIVVTYDNGKNETDRVHLDPTLCQFGCQIPADEWHSVEVYEPTVIIEMKDGRYGEDGSVSANCTYQPIETKTESSYDLKYLIANLIGQERIDGNLDKLTPEYIGQTLGVSVNEVEEVLREMQD